MILSRDEGKEWAERRRELGRLKTKLNKAGPLAQKKHAEIIALKGRGFDENRLKRELMEMIKNDPDCTDVYWTREASKTYSEKNKNREVDRALARRCTPWIETNDARTYRLRVLRDKDGQDEDRWQRGGSTIP